MALKYARRVPIGLRSTTRAPSRAPAREVCLAASPGGHVALLRAVDSAFEGSRRSWVTGESAQAAALAAEGEEIHELPNWARDAPGLRAARSNLSRAVMLARSLRPAMVVTSGAGLVAPFALAARLGGSRLVFIETMARVAGRSLSGRLLAPLCHSVIVQWPELLASYPKAVLCRPALLSRGEDREPRGAERRGTFVSVGTRPEPFDRLLAAVDRAIGEGVLPTPVIAQSGHSTYRPSTYTPTPWMEPEEVEQALATSRYAVCHAGSAVVAAAVSAGHRPLVMARDAGRGEHRTRHQEQVLAKLSHEGAVVPITGHVTAAEVEAADEIVADRALDSSLPQTRSWRTGRSIRACRL